MKPMQRNAGYILIEFIVGMALLGLALVLFNQYLESSAKRNLETLAATQMRQLVDASERYISDNNAALRGTATASAPATVTVAALKSAQYLGPQFPTTNVYQQAYEVRVLQPTAGVLSTLIVTTGGETVGEGSLRRIARQVGAAGGYVSTSSATQATGAYGGWIQTLSTYGAANGGGRLAAALFFRDGQQVTDFLYRGALPGHPEVNTMATSLEMANNHITGAGNVTASGTVTAANMAVTKVVVASTACAPNGLLGRLSTGALMVCVSGLWRAAGT
jgi:type II secretory pathway pseudopilin PulG